MDNNLDWMNELGRPFPYQGGAPFWTDRRIAAELLKEHLRPDADAASYRPETIAAICDRLGTVTGWQPGNRVVDLGCGPGLYCAKLTARGVSVTGIDQSETALRYAETLCEGQNARFLRASYLEPFGSDAFDAAMMVSQDYGVLSPENRKKLLANVRGALRPGGRFALDVSSLAAYETRAQEPARTWETAERGLWRPHPYLALHAVHLYPAQNALCDLYAVLDGTATVYRIWQTFFSPESITRELTQAGFAVEAIWADLKGCVWNETSPSVGVLCRRE